ncbi:MAG TPA: DUF262 domain-containing protein [Hymenobacter sp.]|jgi:hypothetical protein|uniref:DUF262 domain-containing protein n=1 Tax=Hymenobacter sp. TaxID=1898978 RepID=UPI002ED7BECD
MDLVITRTVYKVSDFLSWQRSKSLVLSPSFQRRAVWPAAAKSFLLDTVLQGLPMPIIFLREQTNLDTLEPYREVVDGQQRLRTLLTYIAPEHLKDYNEITDFFTIKKNHNETLANKAFSQLPNDIKRKILSYEFSVHVLPPETEDREVLQIFARMNATGIKLNNQELRNAKFFGVFKTLVYNLAYSQLSRWREWKIFSEGEIARMSEVEETSDLIMTMLSGVRGKTQSGLDNTYQKYDNEFADSEEIARRFYITMDTISDTIGDKIYSTALSRRPVFHTLFSFYYDLLFGLNSGLDKAAAKPFPKKAAVAVLEVATAIVQENVLDEEIAKVLRSDTTSNQSRTTRLVFFQSKYADA